MGFFPANLPLANWKICDNVCSNFSININIYSVLRALASELVLLDPLCPGSVNQFAHTHKKVSGWRITQTVIYCSINTHIA